MRRKWQGGLALVSVSLTVFAAVAAGHAAQMMTRTLKEKPATVIAAFGTSTRAQVTYDAFETQLRETFPEHEVRWAFTSEVIRQIVNARRKGAGAGDPLASLQQVLADLEAEGHRKVAAQPLHIFPGEEYEEALAVVERFPGLAVESGETLLQRWEGVHEVLNTLSPNFLTPAEGCNVLVAHDTPTTHVGSNITLLGLDRLVARRYSNVFLGAVEGVVTRQDALEPARTCSGPKVRFIPLMYVAGDHIMNDIMGEAGAGEEPSWREEVERAGKAADAPTVRHEELTLYRGMGFLPAVNRIFLREIQRALDRM